MIFINLDNYNYYKFICVFEILQCFGFGIVFLVLEGIVKALFLVVKERNGVQLFIKVKLYYWQIRQDFNDFREKVFKIYKIIQ